MKHFYLSKVLGKQLFLLLLAMQIYPLWGQSFKTIGYLPYYRFSLVDQIDFSKITHLNIAFAHPDADGYLDVFGQNIMPIVAAGHAAGAEVFIALALIRPTLLR